MKKFVCGFFLLAFVSTWVATCAEAIQPKVNKEYDKAYMIIMQPPTIANFFTTALPTLYGYKGEFNYKKARKEAEQIINTLRLKGVNVITIEEILLKGRDPQKLKDFISENLVITKDKDLNLDLDTIKKEIIEANDLDTLLDLLLNGFSANLSKDEKSTSGIGGKISFEPLVDLFYMRDQMITTDKGIVLCNFESKQRKNEVALIKLALDNIGISPIYEVTDPGRLEGGDFFMNGDSIFIGIGPRTNEAGAKQLMDNNTFNAKTVVLVKDRLLNQAQMHLDTYFNMLDSKLVVLAEDRMSKNAPKTASVVDVYELEGGKYKKVEEDIDFYEYLNNNGFIIIPVSEEDSAQLATNFITIAPRTIVGPSGVSEKYKQALKKHDVSATWVDMKNIKKGYGAARCITRPIIRQAPRQ
ncbi:MAG: hypothetical protein H8D55_00265 [Deltaproteobacteria bacterium]|nr:hypothetical protein [Deltaproteobacteria bacterium]